MEYVSGIKIVGGIKNFYQEIVKPKKTMWVVIRYIEQHIRD